MRGSKSQLGFQFVKTEGAKPDAPEEIKRVVEDIDEQTCMLRRVDQLGGMFSCSFCAKEIQSRRTKGANRTKLNTSGVVRHLLNFCRNFRTKHQAAMDWLLAKREMIPKSGRKTSEQGALMARTMATQLVPAVQPTPNAIAVPLYSNLPQAGGNLERLQQALWELFGDLSIVLIVVSYVDGSFSVPVINDSRKLGLPTAGLFQPNLQPTMPMTADIYTNPPGTTSILSGPSVNVTGVHVPGINVPGVVSGVVPVNVPEHEHSGTLSTSQLQSSQLSPQLTQVELQALINAQIPNAPMPNAQMSNAPISNTTMPNVPVSTPTIPGEVEVLNAVELSSQPAPAPSPNIPIERAMVCPFCREAVHMPPNAPWMHTCLQSKNAPLLDPGLDHRMPCPMLNCSKLIKTFRHQTLKSDMYKHIQVVHSAALKNGLKIEDVKRVVRFWLECHGLRKKSRKGSGFNLPGEPNVREMKTSRANTSSNTLMPRAAKRRKINPRSKQEPRECLELIYPKNARFSAGQFFNPDISLKMKKLGIPSETEPVVAELRLGSFPPFKCNTLSTIDGCLWVKIGDQKDFVRTVQNVFNDTAKQCASVYPLEVEWSFEVRLKQMGQELTSYTIVINAGKAEFLRFARFNKGLDLHSRDAPILNQSKLAKARETDQTRKQPIPEHLLVSNAVVPMSREVPVPLGPTRKDVEIMPAPEADGKQLDLVPSATSGLNAMELFNEHPMQMEISSGSNDDALLDRGSHADLWVRFRLQTPISVYTSLHKDSPGIQEPGSQSVAGEEGKIHSGKAVSSGDKEIATVSNDVGSQLPQGQHHID